MHIIANSGSVRCLIINSEKPHVVPAAQGNVEDQRNQMGFRFVILADFSTGVGAGSIEVPKSDRLYLMSTPEVIHFRLADVFSETIWID